ncbi:MAG TPA: hypothetical protein VMZ53_00715 [Kofleriaceae bacterium]|nr:hypothetical protein [Kofleriaceae bacterium]
MASADDTLGNPATGAPGVSPDNEKTGTPASDAPPTPTGQLPPAKSDHDPAPPVPTPAIPGVNADVVEQAGVGGAVGYGRAGVLELGGSAGLTMAQDVRALNFSPSVGWFLIDNFEISAILDVTNLKAGGESATLFSALVEPSFHLPINRSMFGFVGMGIGAAYQHDLGSGMAVAPRVGMDFLVGRSGILRPSLAYEYTTHDSMAAIGPDGSANVTLVAISSALRFNIGYSSMW